MSTIVTDSVAQQATPIQWIACPKCTSPCYPAKYNMYDDYIKYCSMCEHRWTSKMPKMTTKPSILTPSAYADLKRRLEYSCPCPASTSRATPPTSPCMPLLQLASISSQLLDRLTQSGKTPVKCTDVTVSATKSGRAKKRVSPTKDSNKCRLRRKLFADSPPSVV